jgi:AAA ATPase domain
MALRPLPSPWNVYNLVGSPFFQETLESGDRTPRPLSLFVGRRSELKRLVGGIHGAGANSSRQAVAGAPGVGKTTLVKELKAVVLEEGYLTADEFVPILAGDTAESLFGRVLGALYDTIIANRPQSGAAPAMQAAQVLVRVARLGTGGLNLSAFGFGAGASKGTTVVTPKDILIDGPRVMRDLMDLVQGADARGVLLHLDNLENLSESDAARAAEILRDLRDLMLLHSGLHYVIVGTVDAVSVAVNAHQQIRNIVGTLVLEPLGIADVHRMLEARYAHLRADPTKPVSRPVAATAVELLHEFFRGDLRGLLKALDDGITPLIGLAGTDHAMSIADLRPVLQRRYAAELGALTEQARVQQLTRWGTETPGTAQTQKSLAALWKVSQPAVSAALVYLVRQGYVQVLPRAGSEATRYVLSGVSRLIF